MKTKSSLLRRAHEESRRKTPEQGAIVGETFSCVWLLIDYYPVKMVRGALGKRVPTVT